MIIWIWSKLNFKIQVSMSGVGIYTWYPEICMFMKANEYFKQKNNSLGVRFIPNTQMDRMSHFDSS